MGDVQIQIGVLLQVFQNQTAVALMRLMLAAQQAAMLQKATWHIAFHIALRQQSPKFVLKLRGGNVAILVLLHQAVGGRPIGHGHIINIANFAQKKAQIIALGKACQLRHIVQTHVQNGFDLIVAQQGKKLFGRFLGKAQAEHSQGSRSGRSFAMKNTVCMAALPATRFSHW